MRKKTAVRAAPPPATELPVPSDPHPALAALLRSRWIYLLVSLLLLVPCYWQPRIQAGDLSSHIYNSWLAQSIESQHLQGLAVVGQTTNILFDLLLSGLFRLLGAGAAQHISVSLAVLIFVWGVFALSTAVSCRRPWQLLPCIAILAYGWVFHMGFFDFYLSLGLCTWVLALLWKPSYRRVAAAVPLIILAYLSHALPVAWAASLWAYAFLAARISPRFRIYLIAGSLLAMIGLRTVLAGAMVTRWSAQQLTLITGLDQLWVFDSKYYGVMVGMLLVWGSLLVHLMRLSGARKLVSSMAFQFCAITAAGVFILPSSVLIPGYKHALVFIAERMSLGIAICVCTLLAAVPLRRLEQYTLILVTIAFFGFLFRDDRMLNGFEDRMQKAVDALPPGQRVISAIDDPDLRVNALAHMVDRVCLGHCYSYANYEASTAQFRVRATAQNPYVAYTYEDSWMLQVGLYVVKDRDLPLYQVDLDGAGQMVIKSLPAGAPSGNTPFKVLGEP